MNFHGNSNRNNKPHHLYEIVDEEKKDTFKYGISCDPIEADGLSERVRDQVDLFNLIAGWLRFFARILQKDIPGRKEASKIETEHIEAYRQQHGRRPIGNKKG